MPPVDLTAPAAGWRTSVTTSTEHDDERASRLRREEAGAVHKLAVEAGALRFAGFVLAVVLLTAVYGATLGTPEQQRLAWPVVSALGGGVVGYLFGKRP